SRRARGRRRGGRPCRGRRRRAGRGAWDGRCRSAAWPEALAAWAGGRAGACPGGWQQRRKKNACRRSMCTQCGAGPAATGGFRSSMLDDDVNAVFEVVHDAAQDFRQQPRHLLALFFTFGGKNGGAAAGQVFAQRDDGGNARSVVHEPPSLSSVASPSGHKPEATGRRTLPSSTGTYSTARIKASGSLSSGTMAITTSPFSGFCLAIGISSSSSTSIFSPSSKATS